MNTPGGTMVFQTWYGKLFWYWKRSAGTASRLPPPTAGHSLHFTKPSPPTELVPVPQAKLAVKGTSVSCLCLSQSWNKAALKAPYCSSASVVLFTLCLHALPPCPVSKQFCKIPPQTSISSHHNMSEVFCSKSTFQEEHALWMHYEQRAQFTQWYGKAAAELVITAYPSTSSDFFSLPAPDPSTPTAALHANTKKSLQVPFLTNSFCFSAYFMEVARAVNIINKSSDINQH